MLTVKVYSPQSNLSACPSHYPLEKEKHNKTKEKVAWMVSNSGMSRLHYYISTLSSTDQLVKSVFVLLWSSSILLTNSNSWKEGERASCWDSAESSLLFLAFLLDLSDHLTLDVELYILYKNNSGTIGRSPFCPLLRIDYSRLDIFHLHPQNNMHLPKMFSIPFDTTLCWVA